jgi:putative transposase
MARLSCTLRQLLQGAGMLYAFSLDVTRFLQLCLHSPAALAAENLFLRKQLALYQERHATSRRATDATRFTLVWLSQWFDWRQALTVVQPETFRRWQRQGCCLFWRWPSPPGQTSP